jgi:hypothetical protein
VRVPVAVPRRPVAQQQALLVGGADQILERHPRPFLWRGRGLADEALQQAAAQFLGEPEPLDQAITQLVIHGFAVVPNQAPRASRRPR